jgi:hypothetical protein
MPVVLIEGTYEVCHRGCFTWHDIHIAFHADWFRLSGNIKDLPQIYETLQCRYYCWEGFMNYAVEMEVRCLGKHTKSDKDWFRHSEVNRGDTQTHTQKGGLISPL